MLAIYRFFDSAGTYAGQIDLNVHGPVLTPTGLPVQSGQGGIGWYEIRGISGGTCVDGGLTLVANDWANGLPAGWYVPRLVFGNDDGGGIEFNRPLSLPSLTTLGTAADPLSGGYLPMQAVGAPARPRLPISLLNGAASWGSAGLRGLSAIEDAGRVSVGNRRAGPGPFIASPTDPLSGRPVSYSFEPYLPTLLSGSGQDGPPQVEPALAFPATGAGEISVTHIPPSGAHHHRATSATVRPYIEADNNNAQPMHRSFSGSGPNLGLTTGLPELTVTFEEYGKHRVEVTGILQTIWGTDLDLEGTFEFWVAEPLDLTLGTFEGTPLAVSDTWSPVVHVEPGVAADISVDIAHYGDRHLPRPRRRHPLDGCSRRRVDRGDPRYVADRSRRPQPRPR